MLFLLLYLDSLEASRQQIGMIMGTASVGGVLMRPVVGWALDTVGRKLTLSVGTLLTGCGLVCVWFIQGPDHVAYGVRLLFGVGVGAVFTGYFTFAADLIPESRRTEGLALFGISGLVPLFVNPLSARVGGAPSDLRWFLPLMGVLVALSMIPLLMVKEPARHSREPVRLKAVIAALKHRALWSVWFATIIFSSLAKTFMAFASVVAHNSALAPAEDFWGTYALAAVSVRFFGARLPDRIGPSRLLIPALGTMVAAGVVLASAGSYELLLVAGFLAGLGHGYAFPILSGQAVTRAPAPIRGSAMAMFTGLWEVSAITVPPLLGILADRHGDAAMLWVASGAAIVCLFGWHRLEYRR